MTRPTEHSSAESASLPSLPFPPPASRHHTSDTNRKQWIPGASTLQLYFWDVIFSSGWPLPLSPWPSSDPILLLEFTHYFRWPSWAEFTLVLTHVAQMLSMVTIFAFFAQTLNSKAAVTFLFFDAKQVSSSWLSLPFRFSWWSSDHNPLVWEHIKNWVILLKSLPQPGVKGGMFVSS